MGKKRAAAAEVPVFPFPAVADHFSDYGFDSQLLHFLFNSQVESETTKRPSTRQHHHHLQALLPPPPLESARFKLQKPISSSSSKKHRTKQQQQRRRWWSSAASAALVLFKRQSSTSSNANPTAAGAVRPGPTSTSFAAGPLYLADVDDDAYGTDSAVSSCACWAPAALRSGHLQLATAELGAASAASVPYVSLRNADCSLGSGTSTASGGAAPPVMPIYLVT